jgi:putative PIN family toxin of toxin-antitoxin system
VRIGAKLPIAMNVVDANIIKSGLLSRNGASNVVLLGMLEGTIPFAASTAIILEYEDVLMREGERSVLPLLGSDGVATILDALCRMCRRTSIFYRFRPFLADPKDDLYIECALASQSDTIITFDGHFRHCDLRAFGLRKAILKDILIEMGLARTPS